MKRSGAHPSWKQKIGVLAFGAVGVVSAAASSSNPSASKISAPAAQLQPIHCFPDKIDSHCKNFVALSATPPILRPASPDKIEVSDKVSVTAKIKLDFNASTMILMTDGRVLVQDEGTAEWKILTPDRSGSYINGTWSQAASMQKGRLYYASAVLADGRVIVAGGEYINRAATEDNTVEIYDPVADKWSPVVGPLWQDIGDAPEVTLADGRILMGSILARNTTIFQPKTGDWIDGGLKMNRSAEESWVPLDDGTVITVTCNPAWDEPDRAELWIPNATGSGTWIDAGELPVKLVDQDSEIGAGLRLNDGLVLFIGATGHTAIYQPGPEFGAVGTWVAGPDIPRKQVGGNSWLMVAKDAPAAVLPNGHVIITAGNAIDNGGFGASTEFFDFDPQKMTITPNDLIPVQESSPYSGRMMVLPNGELAYSNGTPELTILGNTGTADIGARPLIKSVPTNTEPGQTIQIQGLTFNGVTQAVGYGDDASAATNYPLVRVTREDDGSVFFLRTLDFSSMGVGTGDVVQTASVEIPLELPPGQYSLQVIANGNPSDSVPIHIDGGYILPGS